MRPVRCLRHFTRIAYKSRFQRPLKQSANLMEQSA